MKCKIFKEEKVDRLEQDINLWLASNDKIKVSQILQSSYRYKNIISIWYEKVEDDKVEKHLELM